MRNVPSKRRGSWWLGGLIAVIVMLGWVVPAGASTTDSNPYTAGSSGYDVGWPNCGETPPVGFAIVGLGSGRPFKTNSCLANEWTTAVKSTATTRPALYFNTGYSGAYARNVTSPCTNTHYAGPSLAKFPKHDQSTYMKAWEIGCSEAAYAATIAKTNAEVPSMWWADIETGNSWSTNQTVNQYAVDGISYEMQRESPSIGGVYSYAAAWNKIVGSGFTATPPFAGDWGPNLRCTTTTGFSGAPVWIVQGGTTTSGVDMDTSCG